MKYVAGLLCTLLFSGCAVNKQIGSANLKPEAVAQVEKGKTTKEQILAWFGAPQSTSKRQLADQPGSPVKLPIHLTAAETWSYWSHTTQGTAVVLPFYAQTKTTSNNYVATFYFNDQGVVQDYTTTENHY